uniref:Protein kinase domain-containing protein n=1 Tax=Emiliania huxleyi (strain CCMP1516) TaxID=280463 RepID=A0A0D3JS64_EMIH1
MFFDQSLDEIKLLRYLRKHDPRDEHHVLRMYDYFYHREHLFLVCELLRDNLYEFSRFNRDSGGERYFQLPRLRRIAKQCLEALVFVHRLGLFHGALKRGNILIQSYSRWGVKGVAPPPLGKPGDPLGGKGPPPPLWCAFGRGWTWAPPQVVLGLGYGQKIDLWSLGAILGELHTGYVLFQNDSLATMLARIVGILGPFPQRMLERGRHTHKFFVGDTPYERDASGAICLLRPKPSSLRHRLHSDDKLFLSFVGSLLKVDPDQRPTAQQALQHPWIASDPYQ